MASEYNDGDSFHIRSGTKSFIVRFYFVDAPETNMRYPERTHEQSEYFGVTLDQTLKTGAKARETVRDLLRTPFVVRTRYAHVSGRGQEARYYGFVEVGGTNLLEFLVAQGLARRKGLATDLPTGEKSRVFAERLRQLEAEARRNSLGIWGSLTDRKTD